MFLFVLLEITNQANIFLMIQLMAKIISTCSIVPFSGTFWKINKTGQLLMQLKFPL